MPRRRIDDHQDASWISLVDLLCVLSVVAVVMGIFAVGRMRARDQESARLRAELSQLDKQLKEWEITFEGLEDQYEALSDQYADLYVQFCECAKPPPPGTCSGCTRCDEVVAKLKAENAALKAEIAQLKADNAELIDRVNVCTRTHGRSDPPPSDTIAQELLGLPGNFGSTVFVVDRSGSMSEGGRWEIARNTVRAFVEHLPVSKGALVVFGSDVRIIPSELYRGPDSRPGMRQLKTLDEASRKQMLDELDGVSPGGGTCTEEALQRAMEFKDLDAIILFTDGSPEGCSQSGNPKQRVIAQIQSFRKRFPAVRIHAVGIGDYFSKEMRQFLQQVTESGSGGFVGR